MLEFTRRSGIVIPKEYENESWYALIRAHLFRTQRDYQSKQLVSTKYFSESEKFLTIPRHFPIHEYVDCKIIDISHVGEDIDINHNITPRNETQEITMKYMMDNRNGMIKLNPGMGKTVISIYAICEKKKKTFVLVHRESLDKQWRERLEEFTDVDISKVAILNSANFEQQLAESPIIISTCQTYTSLLRRIPMEFLIALDKANVGVFIADEAHTTVGAPTFSMCSIHMPARDTYGLSATPYRGDGNSDIIKYHLAEPFEIDDDSDTMAAEITVILADFGIDIPYREKFLRWEGSFQRSRYLNIMKNSTVFMDLIRALILKLIDDKRHALVISERVDKMINILYKRLKYESKSKFIAGSSLKELEKEITFSTPGKIRDGIDVPWKDALIVTSPVSNMEQLCGRITRTWKGHDKRTPIAIDMVDIGCPDISGSFIYRHQYYTRKDWKINYIYINPNTYEKFKIREEDAFTIINGGS